MTPIHLIFSGGRQCKIAANGDPDIEDVIGLIKFDACRVIMPPPLYLMEWLCRMFHVKHSGELYKFLDKLGLKWYGQKRPRIARAIKRIILTHYNDFNPELDYRALYEKELKK